MEQIKQLEIFLGERVLNYPQFSKWNSFLNVNYKMSVQSSFIEHTGPAYIILD